MKTLIEYIKEAEEKKVAIGHFNISSVDGLWAIVNASKKLNVPVIVGVSEGEREFIGIKQVKRLIEIFQEERLPIFLNADHTYSLEKCQTVIDLNFDSVIIDGAEKTTEENLKLTKAVVDYKNTQNKNILIEGELGFIGKSSKVLDSLPSDINLEDQSLTNKEEALYFVENTKIDLFAPAVGNIHGMIRDGNPKLRIEKIKEIKEVVKVPLVLHGGSGITDIEFKEAINAGITIIHINTELRLAYKQGIQKYFNEFGEEIAPYKYLRAGMQEMQNTIEKRLALFNGI